jgi:hypothetical protein
MPEQDSLIAQKPCIHWHIPWQRPCSGERQRRKFVFLSKLWPFYFCNAARDLISETQNTNTIKYNNWHDKPTDAKKYVTITHVLRQEFSSRFEDFREYEVTYSFFSWPFDVNVASGPDEFQLTIIVNSVIKTYEVNFVIKFLISTNSVTHDKCRAFLDVILVNSSFKDEYCGESIQKLTRQ